MSILNIEYEIAFKHQDHDLTYLGIDLLVSVSPQRVPPRTPPVVPRTLPADLGSLDHLSDRILTLKIEIIDRQQRGNRR